jgi:hypothetical protein
MDKYNILNNINNQSFNSKISIEIFKYIHMNNINYSKNNNNIYFDINILNLQQLNDINNILNN